MWYGRWHNPGGPHAEVCALHSAGGRTRAAQPPYVSMEPCAAHGPNAPVPRAAGSRRGWRGSCNAAADPSPKMGGGVALLREAGLQGMGVSGGDARRIERRFFFIRPRAGKRRVVLGQARRDLDGAPPWPAAKPLDPRSAVLADVSFFVSPLRVSPALATVLADIRHINVLIEGAISAAAGACS